MEFDLEKHTIYKCVHGSRAYGTNTETSDIDFKGVAIAPIDYYLGFCKKFEQAERYVSKGHDRDEVIYDLQKFLHLSALCNPNMIEVLFVDESDIVTMTNLGKKLREHRDLFLSKRARNTFCGYALAQLKRIKNHRRWLLEPPTKKPEREDFGLPTQQKMSKSDLNAYDAIVDKGSEIPESVMAILQKEKQYANAKQQWDQYQNWKNTRNKDRAALEAKHGFDSKHAGHLVRLLRMGQEILDGKGVLVKRPDAQELLAIRNGAWTYDQVIEYAERQIAEVDISFAKSALPDAPDQIKLDALCIELIQEFHDLRTQGKEK